MSTVILATDYSAAARNAALYALELARHMHARLELVHAYIIPFAYTDSPVPLLNIEEIQKIAEDSMEVEISRLKVLAPEMAISSKILPGDIIDCLTEITEQEPAALIVMGTSGAGSDSFLWGSVAVKALRNLKSPVLAIPTNVTWKPVEKICFAADYEQISEHTPTAEILKWCRQFGASIDVIHVDKPEKAITPPMLLVEKLEEADPVYHAIVNENIEGGVSEFLQEHNIGWLLVIPKKYGFFENLFHKSRTKLLTQVSNVPVLAIHQE
jgi:nucleotide-binding universal stress UspA family protein